MRRSDETDRHRPMVPRLLLLLALVADSVAFRCRPPLARPRRAAQHRHHQARDRRVAVACCDRPGAEHPAPPKQRAAPLGKGSTARDVLDFHGADLRGRTAVITGGSTGLGLETAKALASRGCRVVVCALDADAGAVDVARAFSAPEMAEYSACGRHSSAPDVAVVPLDLGCFASIERCAAQLLRHEPRIDMLVLNAGVCGATGTTMQGFEMQMGVNHIGHALLCRLLLPTLQAQPFTSRIIGISSVGHRFAFISADDLQCTYSKFFGWGSYLTSKLAGILHMKALHEHLSGGDNVVALSLSPGIVNTGIWARAPAILRGSVQWICDRDEKRGAATTVWCCVAPECGNVRASGGTHWADCRLTEASWLACDPTLRRRIWEATNTAIDEALGGRCAIAPWR